jgi:acetate kinase
LKYQLIDIENETVLAKGVAERIGSENSVMIHTTAEKTKAEFKTELADHTCAVAKAVGFLTDGKIGVIRGLENIDAVGHRIVHGGENFSNSVMIDDAVMAAIEDNAELAPLHNPANLMGINACRALMPGVPMVAVFDTAFHANMPRKAFLYGLPYNAYSAYRVRRYGFHGTSHKYVSARAAKISGEDIRNLKMITCHLGNGSSVAAVKGGVSVDTSMGFTPLEGLAMGTRSGDIDAAIVPHLMKKMDMDMEQAIHYLNKKSGVRGISGISNDFRDLWKAADNGNEEARIALDVFSYKLKKTIGSYAAVMGGADVIVFTGGIGENDARTREKALSGLEFLGVELDCEKNKKAARTDTVISAPESGVKVLVVPTNEELMIAMDTHKIVSAMREGSVYRDAANLESAGYE